MRVKYHRPGQLRLLLKNTDSLAYAIQTDDIYRDIAEDVLEELQIFTGGRKINNCRRRNNVENKPKKFTLNSSKFDHRKEKKAKKTSLI